MKQELRLSGTGGQGLITAGIILAEAALLDGKLAIQSQSYGPEARGGASKAEVIISDEAIHFPKVTDPNLLLAMSQEAATKYSHDLTAGSVMIPTVFSSATCRTSAARSTSCRSPTAPKKCLAKRFLPTSSRWELW